MSQPSPIVAGAIADSVFRQDPHQPAKVGRQRPQFGLWIVVVVCTLYFLFPIWAVFKFTADLPMRGWTLKAYTDVLGEAEVRSTLWLSMQIAFWTILLSLTLMLWTTVWANLRVKKLLPAIEFISILPYMVPPIAFVVGIAGVFRPTFPGFLANWKSLIFFYVVLSMPFTYRSIDAGLRAIDIKTLTEASRGLGAGWPTTILKVIVPNIRAALLGATCLTVAIVLGEYTIASLLLKDTFATEVAKVAQQQLYGGPALGLLSMLVVAVLFGALGLLTRKRGGARVASAIV